MVFTGTGGSVNNLGHSAPRLQRLCTSGHDRDALMDPWGCQWLYAELHARVTPSLTPLQGDGVTAAFFTAIPGIPV